MIPRTPADLDDLLAEIERQDQEVIDLFDGVPEEVVRWRPDADRWSLAGHLEHLCIVNEGYLDTLEGVVEDARDAGSPESDGPYRHPWLSRRFVRMLEPPPGLRVRTFRSLVPKPDVDGDGSLRRFLDLQSRLASVVDGSRGLDLGAIRFASPVFRFLRLSLGAGLEAVLAHNRRHVWLMRELMEDDDFPG